MVKMPYSVVVDSKSDVANPVVNISQVGGEYYQVRAELLYDLVSEFYESER